MADSEIKIAADMIDDSRCNDCPLLAVADPTDNIINELVAGLNKANEAIKILNMAIKERDIENIRLNNALDRHAMKALRINKYN
ncbi:MAG: hypothetical protein DRH93_03320 [Deltaproteobacteria bacterium]|nr:MAG: hypothetical protein DRH93_03320 [Deltaproteobacteria bacterium]